MEPAALARVHLAIVAPDVARALMQGLKRVETRLYRQRRAPLGRITRGDIVHFKVSGGGLLGTTQVVDIKEVTNLTPAAVDVLRRRYQGAVQAAAGYWAAKRRSRYGVLIWLGPLVSPPSAVVVPRQYGSGWLVLRES